MKPLPIQSLPADRMAELTRQGARELRAERILAARERWHNEDNDAGNGGCAVVGCLVLALLMYAVLYVIW